DLAVKIGRADQKGRGDRVVRPGGLGDLGLAASALMRCCCSEGGVQSDVAGRRTGLLGPNVCALALPCADAASATGPLRAVLGEGDRGGDGSYGVRIAGRDDLFLG